MASENKQIGNWCDECRYFSSGPGDPKGVGICERYPPVWDGDSWEQPVVSKYISCGEFKPLQGDTK